MAEEIAIRQASFSEGDLLRPEKRLAERIGHLATIAKQNPLGLFGLIVIVVFVGAAVLAPIISPFSPNEFAGSRDEGLSSTHYFGTERLGRDIFSRVVYGSRISLSVAVISVLAGGALGIVFGITSGYLGGLVDSAIQRTVDAAIAFPALLLLLIITQAIGPYIPDIPVDLRFVDFHIPTSVAGHRLPTVIPALALAVIPGVTRVVRGAVLSEKNNQYIEAARASGAWAPRILFRHILPNVVALGIIVMTTLLGGIILAESALSFLGLGIPNATSWGQDVSKAREFLPYHIPAAVFPGGAITLTVLGFNLLGDAIRDIADPRLRGSR